MARTLSRAVEASLRAELSLSPATRFTPSKSNRIDSIDTRLHEQRMAAQRARTLHTTVGSDDHLDLDLAHDVHAFGKFRIRGSDFTLDLALALFRPGRLRECVRSQDRRQRHAYGYFPNPPGSHRHHPPLNGIP